MQRHHIYIDSRHRAAHEAAWHFTVPLPEGAATQDDPTAQNMRVALRALSFEVAWDEVTPLNNAFFVGEEPVALEPGNWPFDLLARAIGRAQSTAACRYDVPSGRLVFTAAAPFSLDFAGGEAWDVLGFRSPARRDSQAEGAAHVLRSEAPLRGRRTPQLFLRLLNATREAAFQNFQSAPGGAVAAPCATLCPVPLTADPFTHQHTDLASLGEACAVTLADDALHALELELVDEAGAPATFVSEWTAMLTVEVREAEDPGQALQARSLQALEQVRGLLDQLVTLKIVGTQRPRY